MATSKIFRSLTYATLLGSIGACSNLPAIDKSYDPPAPVQPAMAPATDGAIYQANAGMRLFEDL